MNNTETASYNVGVAKGQTEEKANQLTDKAGSMFQSAKETVTAAGATVATKAQEATEAVKNATGMNK